ncbi:MAG: hypothetical protein V4621_07765 [Pseudomonadota bacterium]
MSHGPGKYDPICTKVREETEAAFACVIISHGNQGSGFSVQSVSPKLLNAIPDILESIAKQIRTDMKGMQQ